MLPACDVCVKMSRSMLVDQAFWILHVARYWLFSFFVCLCTLTPSPIILTSCMVNSPYLLFHVKVNNSNPVLVTVGKAAAQENFEGPSEPKAEKLGAQQMK